MAAEPNHQYHPEYWVYAALVIAVIVLLFMGVHQIIAQYQASTGVVLTSDDIASVQDLKPGDLNGQVTLHVTLTGTGADKFASAKPDVPVYFKGHEIGTAGTISGNTVAIHTASLEDATKTKLQLAWKDQ